MERHAQADCCHPKSKSPFLNKNVIAFLITGALVLISYVWTPLSLFRHHLWEYFRQIWWAVLLGFLVGGLLERYVPKEYISSLLAQKKKRTILTAVLFGFLMSACSHGILALSIELHKKGASTPVVVSFLLASPWANLPITLMLLGFFGWKALYIILGALGIAITTGLIFQILEKKHWIESNPNTIAVEEGYSIRQDLKERFGKKRVDARLFKTDVAAVLKGAWQLADMTLWWIVLGVVLSGLAGTLIPSHVFDRFMGPTFMGLVATMILATVLEVCSEGTAPLAFEIFKQTGAFGNAFAFLMGGVVTDLTEIGLIWYNVGKRTALWMPLVALPQVFLLGYLANILF